MKIIVGRIIFITIGVLMLAYSFLVILWSSFNWGARFLLVIGALLVGCGAFLGVLKAKAPAVPIVITALLCLLVIYGLFLSIYGHVDTATYDEKYCVVLGAKVNGDTPSVQLMKRLDAAVSYYEKNPEVTFIVCGGQGSDEIMTEARAMKIYLVSKGIPEDRILEEDTSTSTYENFVNASGLMDDFNNDTKVVFISNDFHICRAKYIAKQAGYENITSYKAKSAPFFYLTDIAREILAMSKIIVFGV